jgi:hypothetical protein
MRCLVSLCVLLTACASESELPSGALNNDLDLVAGNYTCSGAPLTLPACTTGTVEQLADEGADHVPLPMPITYVSIPPASGPHRPFWAAWGEYSYLPPQVYVHNLEHGGVVIAYDPCLAAADVDKLRVAIAQAKAKAAVQPLRYLLTPAPGMKQPVMAAAWRWRYGNSCVNADDLAAFIVARHAMAPENVMGGDSYKTGWLKY